METDFTISKPSITIGLGKYIGLTQKWEIITNYFQVDYYITI